MPEFELGTFSVGTLIGLLLGACLGHALAIRRGKIQSRHNAAIELKKAFRRCALEIENGENPTIVISAEYHKQHEAAMDYSATLNGRALNMFNRAVNEYTEWFKVVCNRTAAQNMYGQDDPEYLKIKNKNPLTLINGILKYANT
ncbi:hypothetical protein [Neptunomonas japonica]|uniref:hypothetical protein n=1 Tax=Neptunomonas japonica TaxID=417574 RepID=UPI00041FB480|nr:hypothetical protein [Neptunomonas japonica]